MGSNVSTNRVAVNSSTSNLSDNESIYSPSRTVPNEKNTIPTRDEKYKWQFGDCFNCAKITSQDMYDTVADKSEKKRGQRKEMTKDSFDMLHAMLNKQHEEELARIKADHKREIESMKETTHESHMMLISQMMNKMSPPGETSYNHVNNLTDEGRSAGAGAGAGTSNKRVLNEDEEGLGLERLDTNATIYEGGLFA
eukprot:UN29134